MAYRSTRFAQLALLSNPQNPVFYNALQWARHPKSAPSRWGSYIPCIIHIPWSGPTRLSIRNCISIGSAVFEQLKAVSLYFTMCIKMRLTHGLRNLSLRLTRLKNDRLTAVLSRNTPTRLFDVCICLRAINKGTFDPVTRPDTEIFEPVTQPDPTWSCEKETPCQEFQSTFNSLIYSSINSRRQNTRNE